MPITTTLVTSEIERDKAPETVPVTPRNPAESAVVPTAAGLSVSDETVRVVTLLTRSDKSMETPLVTNVVTRDNPRDKVAESRVVTLALPRETAVVPVISARTRRSFPSY